MESRSACGPISSFYALLATARVVDAKVVDSLPVVARVDEHVVLHLVQRFGGRRLGL